MNVIEATFYEITVDQHTLNTTCYGSPPPTTAPVDALRLRCDAIESWSLTDTGAIIVTNSGTTYSLTVPPNESDENRLWSALVECLDFAIQAAVQPATTNHQEDPS